MKKFSFIIPFIAGLAICITACNKLDKVDSSKKLYLPKPPVVISSQTNNCPSSTITLTVSAEGATGYIWRINDVVIDSNNSDTITFEKSDAYFPDIRVVSVAGTNASGIGLFSDVTASFSPCSTPEKPTIIGRANMCPTPFARLTAQSKYATSYKWFKNGVEIPNATGATYNTSENAVYTVVGVNALGESPEESNAFNLVCKDCDLAFYLWGTWTTTGVFWIGGSGQATFSSRIVAVNDTLFRLDRFNGSNFSIYFMRDSDGDYYMPINYLLAVNVGLSTVNGIQVMCDARQRFRAQITGSIVRPVEGNVYLEVSSDRTAFRFPQEFETNLGTVTNPEFGVFAVPAGGSENAYSGLVYNGTGLRELIFRIPGTSSGSFDDADEISQITWIKSSKTSVIKCAPIEQTSTPTEI